MKDGGAIALLARSPSLAEDRRGVFHQLDLILLAEGNSVKVGRVPLRPFSRTPLTG